MNYQITKFLSALLILLSAMVLPSCNNQEDAIYQPIVVTPTNNTIKIRINSKEGGVFNYSQLLADKGISATGSLSKSSLPIDLGHDDMGNTFFTLYPNLPQSSAMIDHGKVISYTSSSTAFLQVGNQHFDVKVNWRLGISDKARESKETFYGGTVIFIENIECNGVKKAVNNSTEELTITLQEKSNGEFKLSKIE